MKQLKLKKINCWKPQVFWHLTQRLCWNWWCTSGYAWACGGLKGLCLDFTVIGRSSQIWPELYTLVMRRDVRNYCPDDNSTVKCGKFLILHRPTHDPHDDEWYPDSIFSTDLTRRILDGGKIWRFLWFGSIRILPPESAEKKRLYNLVWILWNIRRLSQQIMILKTLHITELLSLCEAKTVTAANPAPALP